MIKKAMYFMLFLLVLSFQAGATTVTYYATSDSNDVGYFPYYGCIDYLPEWSTIQAAATGDTIGLQPNMGVVKWEHTTFAADEDGCPNGEPWSLNWGIVRLFLFFDTSALPDDVIITSVILSLYEDHDQLADPQTICAQKSTAASPLTNADYDAFTGSSYGCLSHNGAQGWKAISFNATGESDVSKTGITKIVVRDYDQDYLGGYTDATSNDIFAIFRGSTHAEPTTRPKLVITYILPGEIVVPALMNHYQTMRRN